MQIAALAAGKPVKIGVIVSKCCENGTRAKFIRWPLSARRYRAAVRKTLRSGPNTRQFCDFFQICHAGFGGPITPLGR
jgi:hypothetical protein